MSKYWRRKPFRNPHKSCILDTIRNPIIPYSSPTNEVVAISVVTDRQTHAQNDYSLAHAPRVINGFLWMHVVIFIVCEGYYFYFFIDHYNVISLGFAPKEAPS